MTSEEQIMTSEKQTQRIITLEQENQALRKRLAELERQGKRKENED